MNAFRTVFATAAIVCVSSFASYAQAAGPSDWQEILKSGGVTVVTSATRGDRTSYTLESATGRFTLDAAGAVSPEAARAVLALREALSGWKSLVPGATTFTALGDDVRVRVVPTKFAEGTRDFLPYVPSGIVFSAMGGFIDYEFRVKVDVYFLRFRGRFAGERALLDRLVSAIDDPAVFVRDNDPDYHLTRTIEQEEVLLTLTARLDEQAKLIEALDARIVAQGVRIARMETVLIANQAKTRAKPVDPAIITRIAALRAENAAMTSKEMTAVLKGEGVKATVKQIDAVLAILFGEY